MKEENRISATPSCMKQKNRRPRQCDIGRGSEQKKPPPRPPPFPTPNVVFWPPPPNWLRILLPRSCVGQEDPRAIQDSRCEDLGWDLAAQWQKMHLAKLLGLENSSLERKKEAVFDL